MLIGMISDIHEDITRLQEAFVLLEDRGVDEIVCLGDLVGYSVPFYGYLKSRNSNAVLEMIRKRCSIVVIGNHDLYAIRKLPKHRSFFDYPADWYDLDFHAREKFGGNKIFLYENNELPSLLSKENCQYLDSLPEWSIKDLGDHRILFSHYAFPDCTGSSSFEITKSEHLCEQFKVMREYECNYGFSGNDHFNGFQVFTEWSISNYEFERCHLEDDLAWIHGPALSQGTTDNGVMIYNSDTRTIEAIPLRSERHVVPQYV